MALTATLDQRSPIRIGNTKSSHGILTGTVAFDSSYPTGGEDVTAVSKYFRKILRMTFNSDSGYLFEWDKTNNKILVYATADTVAGTRNQVADTTDLSALSAIDFIAIGEM